MKELALHIMDIMQNSITAGSTVIKVGIKMSHKDNILEITVEDNGCGMNESTLEKATNPFHTSRATRLVGLGLPMFKEAAMLTGGDFFISSEEGKGTLVKALFCNESIDRQPLGDLGNVFFLTMLSHNDLELDLVLASGRGTFTFCSKDFVEAMAYRGDDQMNAAFRAETMINGQIKMIFKDILPEIGGGTHGIEGNSKTDKRDAAL